MRISRLKPVPDERQRGKGFPIDKCHLKVFKITMTTSNVFL